MRTDVELQKTFKIFLDENEIINFILFEEIKDPEENTRMAELIEEEFLRIISKDPQKKYNFFVDFSDMKGRGSVSRDSRIIYARITSNKQSGKTAVIGGNVFLRMFISLLLLAFGKGNKIKWCSKKEEAIRWLKKD